MLKSRLNINGVDVPFSEELSISTNFLISDIKEPDKRNSDHTKTIRIPGTEEVNRLFEFAFNVNIEFDAFDPRLKTPAIYYVNEVEVFKGNLQLIKINKQFNGEIYNVEYECFILGLQSDLFVNIAGLYLTDIDFSDLDHEFTFSEPLFNPTLGTGYGYAYQDYGLNSLGSPLTDIWNFKWLKPFIFEREYLLRIFEAAGFSWVPGCYFDSDYEKRIAIPDPNQGPLTMTSTQVQDNQAYIGITADYSGPTSTGSYASGGSFPAHNFGGGGDITPVPFDDETVSYYDPGGIWDEVTDYALTAPITTDYVFSCGIDFDLTFDSFPAGAARYDNQGHTSFSLNIYIQRSVDSGSTWVNVGSFQHNFKTEDVVAVTTISSTKFITMNASLNAGEMIRVKFGQGPRNKIRFYDGGDVLITSGTSDIHFTVKIGSFFDIKLTNKTLIEGQDVIMNTTIPQDITQLDFITSIIKSENLYFERNKENDTEYVFFTRDESQTEEGFYTTEFVDWTSKYDIGSMTEILPMSELDWNRLRLTYKGDTDHYNKEYFDKYKEVYGTRLVDITNDFVKNEKKIELVFSATPIAGSNVNDIVAPRYYSLDKTTNVCQPLKVNIRRLYFTGNISCNEHEFVVGGVTTYRTTYPFIGHLDDPFNPTLDLCFQKPFLVNWVYPGRTYTDNDRYNERYSQMVSQISNPNSKSVSVYCNLNELDIKNFSFRKLALLNDAYYMVQKIEDYDQQTLSVTKVNLLKADSVPAFTPTSIAVDFEDSGNGSQSNRLNNNNGTGIIVGRGNVNNSFGSIIIGDDNTA